MSSYDNIRRAMESDYAAMRLAPIAPPKRNKAGRPQSDEFKATIRTYKSKLGYEYYQITCRYKGKTYQTTRKTFKEAAKWADRKKAEVLSEENSEHDKVRRTPLYV